MCLDDSCLNGFGLGVVVLRDSVCGQSWSELILGCVMWLDERNWYDVRMILALGAG